ncbi:MAG: class I SAM-dependent methyltransferase [Rhodospirillaceae bacterium]|nr:class I SAM-dependent methyltransferase [Rhodospirillales bacterium]MBT4699998.1 class I SAM-dependent methyltransferase [Rhodospirillaceae bacterium]MBT5035325.1 class I SAM-dependent methyltransferase [Rhodospirillaceae bacterium]MBT6221859.1 class I SAM-dependent methyltransferase [Rhodospirillaceae bacterium]MBT6361829.1 class I SAM-dependent methyltransferase [Rhodospirillaceae bacterium]
MPTFPATLRDLARRTRRFPVVQAIVAQVIGSIGVVIAAGVLPDGVIAMVHPFAWTAVAGGIAAISGAAMGMASWWKIINLIFPPSVYAAMTLAIPGWIFLALFAVLVAVYWNSIRGVPLYLTNPITWAGLADLLPKNQSVTFADLGCGIGGTLGYLAKSREDCVFTGIESAPIPFSIAKLRTLFGSKRNIHLRYGNMWNIDLSEFDVVYAFLSPAPMERLFEKVRREMKPGSIFISNSFMVPGESPTETVEISDRRQTKLLIWRF